MQAGDTTISDLEEKLALLINQKAELDEEVKDLEGRLEVAILYDILHLLFTASSDILNVLTFLCDEQWYS